MRGPAAVVSASNDVSLRLVIGEAGRYLISITSSHWIDVVADGKPIDSVDHEGQAGCALLHKLVEFELPAGNGLWLQPSGRDAGVVDLVITKVSPGE